MNNIFLKQFQLIKECSNYIKNSQKIVDTSLSPKCFLTPWANTPGKLIIDDLNNYKNTNRFFYILKNILSISKNFDLRLFYNKKNDFKKFDQIIVSYSRKDDYDQNGKYKDNYFSINNASEKNNFIWFLISLDHFVPEKFDSNIVILAKRKKDSFSFIYFISAILKIFYLHKLNFKKIKHFCWFESDFSFRVSYLFKIFFQNNDIKKVIFNYEGIPFQHNLIKTIKTMRKNVKTYGYLHCAPWPLQTDLFYKKKLLNKLIVSGVDQKKVLCRHFGWNDKDILIIPSLRFDKKNKKVFRGSIFIPFSLNKYNNYLKSFENFLQNTPNKFLNSLKVRVHPLNKLSIVHQNFSKEINNLIKKYKKKFSKNNKNLCIFFGSATGVCVQALEEGNEIIHFPLNNTLDVFSSKIWKNLRVNEIKEGIFKYKILIKGKMFYTTYEKNKFQKYFLPILK